MVTNLESSSSVYDYEFTGFMFNNRHCSEFSLTAVSSGFTQGSLFSEFEDKLLEVSGKDGAYYFGTKVKSKIVPLTLAFDNMTSINKRNIISWLNPKTISKIIFDEAPYKYYWVKIASNPIFSFVPFETETLVGNVTTKTHIFKGQIEINFIALDPYSYSDYSLISDVPIWNGVLETWQINKPYSPTLIPGWYGESGLHISDTVPGMANANDIDGWTGNTVIGNLTPNFYNGGNLNALVDLNFTIPAFATTAASVIISKQGDATNKFELASLRNISVLSVDSGPWTIVCEPKKGLITCTIGSIIYNLGGLTTGSFLNVSSGDNYLAVSGPSSLTSLTIKYKYTYW